MPSSLGGAPAWAATACEERAEGGVGRDGARTRFFIGSKGKSRGRTRRWGKTLASGGHEWLGGGGARVERRFREGKG
jgi:hypothetical protein